MKKRIFALLSVLVFAFSLFGNVYAEENNGKTIDFNLTSDDKNKIIVKSGDEIIVNYTLENADADEDFFVTVAHTMVVYDKDFFEFKGIVKSDERNIEAGLHETSLGNPRIYFNGYHLREKSYAAKQFMGSFKLKVKAKSGMSEIKNLNFEISDERGVRYIAHTKNLLVSIGEEPETLYTITYKNGDKEVGTATAPAGNIEIDQVSPLGENGYAFGGWKNEDDGKIYQKGDIFSVSRDTTFTAVWNKIEETKKYTLTFNTNGGSNRESISVKENTVVDLSEYTTEKSGYIFKGWYADASLTKKVTSITLDGDKTVYAKWEKIYGGSNGGGGGVTRYTLAFEVNGGTDIESVSKVKNTTVDLSKYITKKEGYSFDGWYTDKGLTNKVTEVKMINNITLYAKWVEGDNGYVENPSYKPDIFSSDHYAYVVGRDGGYIYPNERLTRAEAAEMFYRLLNGEVRTEAVTQENGFDDVNSSDWFNTSVSTLSALGVLNGRTEDSFAPNENITRAELTTIIARLSEAEYNGEDIFSDVDGHWAEDSINIAASIGWVTGDNGLFRPNDGITRAEVITLINRALNRVPESKSDLLDGMITPPDNTDENAWYYLAIQEAVNSHNFEKKADNTHEKWTELTENPDWAKLND